MKVWLSAERQPVLVATMTLPLDGQDDPAESTANVTRLLDAALAGMRDAGAIRGYTLEVRP